MKLINTTHGRKLVSFAAMAAVALAITMTPGKAMAVANEPAEQIVFSGIGVARQGFVSRFGFWIWCTAEGNGPYAENHVCAGSVYLYRIGLTLGVNGYVVEEVDGTYTMHVFPNHPENQPNFIEAFLHNVSPEIQHGPNNVVEFDVFTSLGLSRGESTDAVVVVSGPGGE